MIAKTTVWEVTPAQVEGLRVRGNQFAALVGEMYRLRDGATPLPAGHYEIVSVDEATQRVTLERVKFSGGAQ